MEEGMHRFATAMWVEGLACFEMSVDIMPSEAEAFKKKQHWCCAAFAPDATSPIYVVHYLYHSAHHHNHKPPPSPHSAPTRRHHYHGSALLPQPLTCQEALQVDAIGAVADMALFCPTVHRPVEDTS